MKREVLPKNVLHIKFKNQKELTLTMCRPQEFYECKSKKLRGNRFTFEDFLDYNMDTDGNISYYNFWSGFNIPGDKLNDFFRTFSDLSKREQKLFDIVKNYMIKKIPYYVIGTVETDKVTVIHELAHAAYYIDDVYKQEVNVLVKHMDSNIKRELTSKLTDMGYAKKVIVDEINAYMSTSSRHYFKSNMDITLSNSDLEPFVELFNKMVLQNNSK